MSLLGLPPSRRDRRDEARTVLPKDGLAPARGTRVVRSAAFLAQLPAGFADIRDLAIGEKEFLILDAKKRKEPLRVRAVDASSLV